MSRHAILCSFSLLLLLAICSIVGKLVVESDQEEPKSVRDQNQASDLEQRSHRHSVSEEELEDIGDPEFQTSSKSVNPSPSNSDARDTLSNSASRKMDRLGVIQELERKTVQRETGEIVLRRLLKTTLKHPLVMLEESTSSESGHRKRETFAAAGHLIVQFDQETSKEKIEEIVTTAGYSVGRHLSHPGLTLVSIPNPRVDSLERSIEVFSSLPGVDYAEIDSLVFGD